ncbi:MAG: hypothetical protein JSS79_11335 [Bacteroidetes bacterium]|nr:hypothetical protein [Bacteroidota bacterium]
MNLKNALFDILSNRLLPGNKWLLDILPAMGLISFFLVTFFLYRNVNIFFSLIFGISMANRKFFFRSLVLYLAMLTSWDIATLGFTHLSSPDVFRQLSISYILLFGCFAMVRILPGQKMIPYALVAGGVSVLLFHLFSNGIVWLNGYYSSDAGGLLQCYIAASPFIVKDLLITISINLIFVFVKIAYNARRTHRPAVAFIQ